MEPVIVENRSHDACLRIKRSCDIVFDHLQGHFGISSLESLCHGVPVVAGLDDWNIANILEATGAPAHPWVIARDQPALARALEALVADPALRREIGAKSRAWMERYWNETRWVGDLIRFYKGSESSTASGGSEIPITSSVGRQPIQSTVNRQPSTDVPEAVR